MPRALCQKRPKRPDFKGNYRVPVQYLYPVTILFKFPSSLPIMKVGVPSKWRAVSFLLSPNSNRHASRA
jgi:hypothetical protein